MSTHGAAAHGGWPWAFGPGVLDTSSVSVEFTPLRTSDGSDIFGVFYYPGKTKPKTSILVVHPRLDFTKFYATPSLTAAGYGVFCLTTRYLNNDSDATHERMIIDIATGMRHLRDLGIENVILIGNSGGGSLTSFYQSQAALAPEARFTHSPDGAKVPLATEDMPLASGQVQVAVHVGEGDFMKHVIDPSVVDESDPTLSNPEFDMYDERNGRRPYPETSTYDREWLAKYRLEQERRCERLDLIALGMLGDKKALRAGMNAEQLAASPTLRRIRMVSKYMVVYRTLANPFYLDPTIEPSKRLLGSCVVNRQDPIIGNYAQFGFARLVSPRAWLSNWSPNRTQTSMYKNLKTYDIPSLFVEATGDTEVSPHEFHEIVESSISTDKTVTAIDGDHYLRPLQQDGSTPRKDFEIVLNEWLGARFTS